MEKENINNLVSLWKLTGEAFDSYQSMYDFEMVNLDFSEWPNRIWSQQQMLPENNNQLKELMRNINPLMAFSEWTALDERDNADRYGMKLKSSQVGMSLRIEDYIIHPINNLIDIVPVGSNTESKQWSILFQQSFGYIISDQIIDRIKNQVLFFNLKYENQFVGTVVTYTLNNSIGIHSMGILKEFRKRGFSEMVMQAILLKAKEEKLDYAHLQASSMGLGLYEKLGFEKIFNMYNYIVQ